MQKNIAHNFSWKKSKIFTPTLFGWKKSIKNIGRLSPAVISGSAKPLDTLEEPNQANVYCVMLHQFMTVLNTSIRFLTLLKVQSLLALSRLIYTD